MEVSQAELAEVFGVSSRTIRRWTNEGMPSEGGHHDRTYRTSQCIEWRLDRKVERVEGVARELEGDDVPPAKISKARREAVRAREAELRLAEREDEIISRDAFHDVLGTLLDRLRQAILAIPGRWATQLVGLESPREAEEALKKVSRELLDYLSGDLADEIEAGGAPEST